jgi:hypothetical protein
VAEEPNPELTDFQFQSTGIQLQQKQNTQAERNGDKM